MSILSTGSGQFLFPYDEEILHYTRNIVTGMQYFSFILVNCDVKIKPFSFKS
jgi:hypothetical protein